MERKAEYRAESGHDGLDRALADFGSAWTFGLEEVSKDSDEFARLLDASAKTYEEVDDQLARASAQLMAALGEH